ncbi:hypothetical protein A2V56_04890 [Candidatus Woesebacteria bacterium RBG_19FT_COMBO_42_9]|uniref:Uncharacterized protein n=1 Tax=Candidatus Woesebacteria bacterium RBG_16_42_24 TaxID=1802485 RepID=A0A1F7XNS6_9BACT|nr:MAG: hypothetical protein A2V97_04120 [Candidatus Woesebacteria bacterium RBG_16_42_24]OGM17734.1 MAG: hypothetical protein A2V56_04890 [Candidatus Woesebacteria bacterium RBG_19FT_COMBO_42_9]
MRCGKVRVVVKTYKEYIGSSLIVTKLTACPDPDCQTIVDRQLVKDQKLRDERELANVRRQTEAKERRTHNISQKAA